VHRANARSPDEGWDLGEDAGREVGQQRQHERPEEQMASATTTIFGMKARVGSWICVTA